MTNYFLAFVFAWSVIDGDTIKVSVHTWPNHAAVEEHVRLVRIDTPEVRAATPCERDLAAKATAYTRQRMTEAKAREIRVYHEATRDSFGRILGEVFLDGASLNDELLAKGHARKYGTKGAWC